MYQKDERSCRTMSGRRADCRARTSRSTWMKSLPGRSSDIRICPHYGYDKIRFIGNAFSGDTVYFEYTLKDKNVRDEKYGMLLFEVYIKNQNGKPLVYMEDRLLVPLRK